MCFSRKRTPHDFSYTVNSTRLLSVKKHKYLGVYFTHTLSWSRHIDHVTNKACRVLGFLRRNAKKLPLEANVLLYKSNVRSVLEYACAVWDPWSACDVSRLERIQNIAIRFVCSNYTRNFSVSKAKESLGWEQLQKRREYLKMKLFHNIFHSRTGIDPRRYFSNPDYVSLRLDHQNKIKEIACKTEAFKMSFFPRTISQWNRLPSDVATIPSNEVFSKSLHILK